MLEKAYFLSDLHLGSSSEPKSFLLLKFLKSLNPKSEKIHIFLLGDIFDLWVAEHDYFIKKYESIIQELVRLKNDGAVIHYFEGNHDLYLDKYFGVQLGFRIHPESVELDLMGKKLRIEHGDQMDPEDKGYLFLRWFLRTSFMKWLAPRLPGWFVVWLGETMSKASRQYTSEVKSISQDRAKRVIYDHANRVYRRKPFDILIAGHVHVAEDIVLGLAEAKFRVINLGSWYDDPKVFILSEEFTGFQDIK
ncbi:MAG: UDP-2,3-diacylglucosamine diphosphatase [Bdellovibrionales bacterium]|nr:UDP-2,3-diacylglucosamine diphosphatase [Bdellovibrionales bacterium]